jgi:hypothetical protein
MIVDTGSREVICGGADWVKPAKISAARGSGE